MGRSFKELFAGGEHTLEEIIILPYRGGTGSGGTYLIDIFELPDGLTWNDFEYVAFYTGNTEGTTDSYWETTLQKEVIAGEGSNWKVLAGYNTASGDYWCTFEARSANTFTCDWRGTVGPVLVKGYRKRTASQNFCQTLPINGNKAIGINQTYEIDIAGQLGPDYVGRDLIVMAEIHAGGSTYSGWASTGGKDSYYVSSANQWGNVGVLAYQVGNRIMVKSGGALVHSGHLNPWGFNTSGQVINSARCRIKVWKIDQYVLQFGQAGGSGGIPTHGVTDRDVTAVANGAYLLDCSNGSRRVTLPAGSVGQTVWIGDYNDTCTGGKLIMISSPSKIHGKNEEVFLDRPTRSVWQYIDNVVGWYCLDGIVTPPDRLGMEVIDILPSGVYTTGTASIPGGLSWSDFDYIEVWAGESNPKQLQNMTKVPSDILSIPGFEAVVRIDAQHNCKIYSTGDGTFGWNYNGSLRIAMVKGYRRAKPKMAKRGKTKLWSGSPKVSGEITFSDDLSSYEDIMVVTTITGTGSGFGHMKGKHTNIHDVSELMTSPNGVSPIVTIGDSSGTMVIGASKITDRSITISYSKHQYTGGITAIYGINY